MTSKKPFLKQVFLSPASCSDLGLGVGGPPEAVSVRAMPAACTASGGGALVPCCLHLKALLTQVIYWVRIFPLVLLSPQIFPMFTLVVLFRVYNFLHGVSQQRNVKLYPSLGSSVSTDRTSVRQQV